MKPIIEVNNLSKKYRYGESQPYYTLRDTLSGLFYAPKQLFRRKQKKGLLRNDEFWALKDISFSLKQGDVLGIIGANGSGKSTLLKILSRITYPTTGEVSLRGRVGSLLEVGTGFQQELTGRENIYLNGAILGMRRSEINKKFDEIVNFSGVEKFLETPVKHYSSGMYMRLAFAVAAHLDSEILIVDEVLAVGDAAFQKKCLGKMGEITKNEGRTILFVSHNMSAIKSLCNKGILLKDGEKSLEGEIDTIIDRYTKTASVKKLFTPIVIPELDIVVNRIEINKNTYGKVYPGKPVRIDIEIKSVREIQGLGIQIMFSSDDVEGRVFSTNTKATEGMDIVIKKGVNHLTCLINNFSLCSGKYRFGFGIDIPLSKSYYFNTDLLYFDVPEIMLKNSILLTSPVYSHVYLDHIWSVENDLG